MRIFHTLLCFVVVCFTHHDDVMKWKHFPRYWPFARGIHRSPVNSPHKSQWRGALKFSLSCAKINVWVNNREAGDLRRHRAHCDVTVMMPVKRTPLAPGHSYDWNICLPQWQRSNPEKGKYGKKVQLVCLKCLTVSSAICVTVVIMWNYNEDYSHPKSVKYS